MPPSLLTGGRVPAACSPSGHRKNILNPGYRVAGIGVVPGRTPELRCYPGLRRRGNRTLGGVVFNDRNRSHFYDLGEGAGGVAISTGVAQTKSWKSGAYAVELPQLGQAYCGTGGREVRLFPPRREGQR